MKKIPILPVLFLLFTFAVAGQEIDKMPSITVSGSAEILIPPDEVIFSLDFSKLDKDLQTARRLNDESVAKMLELTKRFGIQPKNVKTDNISVKMKYTSIRDPKKRVFDEDGDEIGTRIFHGYEVSKTVIVKLTDISKFEEFFGDILKTGITEVNNVRFETSKLRENKDTARDMAMKAAREKASAMAVAINQTIGKAIKVTEVSTAAPIYGNFANTTSNSIRTGESVSVTESLATFAPGAIKIAAEVSVTFLLN